MGAAESYRSRAQRGRGFEAQHIDQPEPIEHLRPPVDPEEAEALAKAEAEAEADSPVLTVVDDPGQPELPLENE